jgi:hypothetical protein
MAWWPNRGASTPRHTGDPSTCPHHTDSQVIWLDEIPFKLMPGACAGCPKSVAAANGTVGFSVDGAER